MLIFYGLLALVTAGGIWATEHIDRPRRAAARRERYTDAKPRCHRT